MFNDLFPLAGKIVFQKLFIYHVVEVALLGPAKPQCQRVVYTHLSFSAGGHSWQFEASLAALAMALLSMPAKCLLLGDTPPPAFGPPDLPHPPHVLSPSLSHLKPSLTLCLLLLHCQLQDHGGSVLFMDVTSGMW